MHHPDRFRQHWNAYCWTIHRRYFNRCPFHDRPRLPSRDLPTPRSRSTIRLDPVDDCLGFLLRQLVSRRCGTLLMYRIGYGCQFLGNSGQWRIPLGIQIVPAVMLLL
jgi:hypothetical protein